MKTITKLSKLFFYFVVYITFTYTALSDESHHERSALVTFSGSSEGLYHKLVGFWL